MYDKKTITICFAPWLPQSFMYTKETENANRFTILYCPLASMLATLNCKGKTYIQSHLQTYAVQEHYYDIDFEHLK